MTLPLEPMRGRVTGTLDTQGHISPANRTVTLVSAAGDRLTQATGSDGSFAFGDLLPTEYHVEVSLPGFAPLVRPNVSVRGGATNALGALQPVWLLGTTSDATVMGKVVATGAGDTMGGQVHFFLMPEGEPVALAAIGMKGEFIQRVPPGTYRLRAEHPLYTTAELNDVTVEGARVTDLTTTPLSMDINPATLVGSVARELDGATPAAAEGALVTLGNGFTTTVGPDGAFRLEGLHAGPQTVRITLAGHHDTVVSRSVELVPSDTVSLEPVTLALDRGTLTGTVALSDGQAARDVTVVVSGTAYSAVPVPDAVEPWRARFQLAGVPVGTYEVQATKAGYARAVSSLVTVTRDAPVDVGTLTLGLLRGDFRIDATSPTSAAGSTRTRDVQLVLSGFTGATSYRASEDVSFTGVSFTPLTSTTQPFTLDAGQPSAREGTHTVYAQYQDAAGNISPVFSATITLDTTAPVAALALEGTLGDGTPSSVRTVSADMTAVLSLSGASEYVLVDGVVSECPASGWAAVPASPRVAHRLVGVDNPHVVSLCARDAAGNVAGPVAQQLLLDADRPTGCALALTGRKVDGTPAPAGRTASTTVTATVSGCSETPAELVLANDALPCTDMSLAWRPFSATAMHALAGPDGANSVHGCVRDAARNVASLASATVTLDTVAPSAPFVVIDEGARYVNAAQVDARGGFVASVRGSAGDGAVAWALLSSPDGTPTFKPLSGGAQSFTFAGEGEQAVYALFRDDVGNTSAIASDTIAFDVTPPSTDGATLTVAPGGSGYVNSVSVLVDVAVPNPPADLERMVVARAASTSACADSDVSAAQPQPLSTPFTYLLDAAEDTKRLCVKLVDAAGNASDFVPDGVRADSTLPGGVVVLDTTEPSVPELLNVAEILSVPDGTPYQVRIRAPVTDAHFLRYERLGGQDRTWVADATDAQTTTFTFKLVAVSDPSRPSGIQNVLRLRARDRAGNTSESSVVITTDITPPLPVQLNSLWVSNGEGRGTVRWKASTSPDVDAYRVYYGSAPGTYTGLYADQGASPVRVDRIESLTLSGLPDGSPLYVTVKAVDRAGNESVAAATPNAEVMLQPNRVSPTQIGSVSVAMTKVARLVRREDVLYALGFNSSNQTVLQPISLARLVSPIDEGGRIRTPAPASLVAGTAWTANDPRPSGAYTGLLLELAIQGEHAFLASGTQLRIFDLRDPMAPALVSALDFGSSFYVTSVAVDGDRAYVGGWPASGSGAGAVKAIDVSSLFDGNPTTVPTVAASVIGTSSNGSPFAPGKLVVSRDRLMQLTTNGGSAFAWNLKDARVVDPSSPFDDGDRLPQDGSLGIVNGGAVASGSYLYVSSYAGFSIKRLNAVWAGTGLGAATTVGSVSGSASMAFEVHGPLAVFTDTDSRGVRSVDLTQASAIDEAGSFALNGVSEPTAVAWYGNYLFVGGIDPATGGGRVGVLEGATPGALRELVRTAEGGSFHAVSGGLWFNGTRVLDLQDGTSPRALSTGSTWEDCHYGGVQLGDRVLLARGSQLALYDLETATDRDNATAPATGGVSFGTPAGTHFYGLALHGTFLVATLTRADGTYLDVYDARSLLARPTATFDFATALRGSVKLTGSTGWSQLALSRGRAFVTLDGPGQGLYAVDLRAALDDDSSTVLGTGALQGFTAPATSGPSGMQGVAVQGSYAYVAAPGGVEVLDVSAALDADPGTTFDATTPRATFAATYAQAVAVRGSYLLVAPTSGSLMALDVSTPLAPKMLGTLPFSRPNTGCTIPGASGSPVPRVSLSISGTRAYLSHLNGGRIVELE